MDSEKEFETWFKWYFEHCIDENIMRLIEFKECWQAGEKNGRWKVLEWFIAKMKDPKEDRDMIVIVEEELEKLNGQDGF